MGMNSTMYAIGKFHKEVIGCMPYPADHYKGVKKGSQVIAWVCSMRTTDSSKMMAECFGIDPWNFNQHIFKPNIDNIDFEDLKLILDTAGDTQDIGVEKTVKLLIKYDFMFIYFPNG